jgi:methionyl-tRNA synthetase
MTSGAGLITTSGVATQIPSDVWRYCLLSHRAETWEQRIQLGLNHRLQHELLKNLGNFVSRVVKFVNSKYSNNTVPDYTLDDEPSFGNWREGVNELLAQYIQHFDAVKPRAALSTALPISQKSNFFL